MVVGRNGVGLICDLWVRLVWVRFVICGCGFVLWYAVWCAVGLFCGGCGIVNGAVLVVAMG